MRMNIFYYPRVANANADSIIYTSTDFTFMVFIGIFIDIVILDFFV